MSNKYNAPKFYNDSFSIIKEKILPLYNINCCDIEKVKVKNTSKDRAVFKITYNNKTYCLKKVYQNEGELLFIYSALEWLYKNNINVPRLIPSLSSNRFVNYNNFLFILTPWINGEKCDFNNLDDVLISSKNLALMHKYSKNFTAITGSTVRKNYTNIYYEFKSHTERILSLYNEAIKKQDYFSKLFLSCFCENFYLAENATLIASNINFQNLTKTLCHGDYVNKNIIFQNRDIWLIDFDNCSFDYASHDISHFLRRLLKRSSINFSAPLTNSIISIYDSIYPLNKDDLKYILAYISYPQKYFKLSKDYYSKKPKLKKEEAIASLEKLSLITKNKINFIKHLEKIYY